MAFQTAAFDMPSIVAACLIDIKSVFVIVVDTMIHAHQIQKEYTIRFALVNRMADSYCRDTKRIYTPPL